MKRTLFAVAALSLLFGACKSKPPLPDEGTIVACGLAIGVPLPGVDTKLGNIAGWRKVAEKAASDARHARVHDAGVKLQAVLAPAVTANGLTDAELADYVVAAKEMKASCDASHAYDDPRFHGPGE